MDCLLQTVTLMRSVSLPPPTVFGLFVSRIPWTCRR